MGISLYTLLHLDIDPVIKRSLFKMLVEFPAFLFSPKEREKIRPWNLFVHHMSSQSTTDTTQNLQITHLPVSNSREAVSVIVSNPLPLWTASTQPNDQFADSILSESYFEALMKELRGHRGELAEGSKYVSHLCISVCYLLKTLI
jgi:hypothetical protein